MAIRAATEPTSRNGDPVPVPVYEFQILPMKVGVDGSTTPDLSCVMRLFRFPEFIEETHPEEPNKARSRLRTWSEWCGLCTDVRLALVAEYLPVRDPKYKGKGTAPLIWAPAHISRYPEKPGSSVFVSNLEVMSTERQLHEYGSKPEDVEGTLGLDRDGKEGAWRAVELVPGEESTLQVPNGIMLKDAIWKHFLAGNLPAVDAVGEPLFDPRQFPDIERVCELDPEKNPLLGKNILWRRKRIKTRREVMEEAEV